MPPSATSAAQMRFTDVGAWQLVTGRLVPAASPPAGATGTNAPPASLDRLFAEAAAALRGASGRGLVLPAGTITAAALPQLCERAHRLAGRADALGIDLLFAGDVQVADEWAPIQPIRESYVFGFSQGQFRIACAPRIVAPHRIRAHHLRARVMLVGGRRVCAILATEVFAKGLREAVTALDVGALIVLSHHPPTRRWDAALHLVADAAPTIVISGSKQPVVLDHEERSWEQRRLVRTPELAIEELRLIRST